MFFRFVCSFFFFLLILSGLNSAPALAQTPNEPLGGWCATTAPNAEYICTFPSAQAACGATMQHFYPGREDLLLAAQYRTDTFAGCEIDQDRARATGFFVGTPLVAYDCPAPGILNGGICTIERRQQCQDCTSGGNAQNVGNPIDVLNGIKHQTFEDFSTADGRFRLTRHYSSRPHGQYFRGDYWGQTGRNWTINELPEIVIPKLGLPRYAQFYLPNNRSESLTCFNGGDCKNNNTDWSGGRGVPLTIDLENTDFDGIFKAEHDEVPVQDSEGHVYVFTIKAHGDRFYGYVKRIEYPDGYIVNYTADFVSDSYTTANGTLEFSESRYIVKSMSDNLGRSMVFHYDTRVWINADGSPTQAWVNFENDTITRPSSVGNISRVDLPDGGYIKYDYEVVDFDVFNSSPDQRLVAMERYDAAEQLIDSESYLYEDTNWPYALTGLIDDAGVAYSRWEYDSFGRAIFSENIGGLNRYSLDYKPGESPSRSREDRITVINPLNKITHYDTFNSARWIEDITGEPSPNCQGDFTKWGPAYSIDREDNETRYARNNKGWPTSTTRNFGTSEQFTVITDWHSKFRRPVRRVEPGLTTEYEIDTQGRTLSITQTDTTAQADAPRRWEFTYAGPNVTSIDGPLDGASDKQFFTYDGANLTSITNELGQITQITAHNLIGAPEFIVDPNGNSMRLEYDSLHRLTDIIESAGNLDARTRLTYNPVNLLTSVIQPNGSALNFIYDDARRLMAITNSVGERIDYTRNAMGGILSTRISGSEANATIEFEITQVTDELNRVIKTATLGGASGLNSETILGYDLEDNLTSITDPRQNNWQQSYDGLNRLVKEIDPLGGETTYGLGRQSDSRNPLSSVTDPRNVTTNYVRNGYGEVIREVSLENGITEYIRDERGLVTQMTDARGIITNYTYDAAGRLLTETYPSEPSSDITYTYDEGPNGIGELTTVTEGFGTTTYAYDSLGHMSSMTRTINGQSYTTRYTYDLAGEVLTETYPSGRTIRMIRDGAARVIGIEAKGPSETDFTPLLSNVTYAAFGPLTGAKFGDGHSLDIAYDTAYRAKALRRTTDTASLMDITFEHDASGNILAMNDNVRPERSQTFTYDALSRLTSAENMGQGNGVSGYGSIGYDYNLGGDRIARNYTPIGGELQSAVYNYEEGTARLTDVTQAGSTLRLFGYDESGSVISDTRSDDVITTALTYGMNARGRLVTVSQDGALAASYTYDMSEQRIVKAVSGEAAIHYHYDGEGRLIAETDAATGTTLREYIWLGLTPIASYGSSYDPEDPVNDNCNPVFRESLAQRLLDRQDRLALVQESIGVLSGKLDDRTARQATVTARKAELEAILAGVPVTNVIRIDVLIGRIADLETRLDRLAASIERLTLRLPKLAERETRLIEAIARISARIERLNTICDDPNNPPPDTMNGGDSGNNVITLSFLHSDHLGRPKFATRADGSVSWDGGITTPFGVQVTALAAQTQALMFPGQYQDLETTGAGVTLSHNWHRTYDPTLGRYLQSDPIGLAGGLNRYAYVGGNPNSFIDPDGQFYGLAFAGVDLAWQLYKNGGRWECVNWKDVGLAMFGGGVLKAFKSSAFVFKTNGSKTYNALRKWMDRRGLKMNKPGQERHHWFFQNGQGLGRHVPDWLKQQPWNINNIPAKYNQFINHKKLPAVIGAPSWFWSTSSGAGLIALGPSNNNPECACD